MNNIIKKDTKRQEKLDKLYLDITEIKEILK